MDPGVIATIIAAVIGAAGSIAAAVITVRAYRRSTSVDSDIVRTSQQERGEPPATSRTSERASTEERRDLPRPEVENRETKGPPSRTHQIGAYAPADRQEQTARAEERKKRLEGSYEQRGRLQRQGKTLASLMEQQEQVLRTLDMTTGGWVDFIHEAKERLLADNFKVLVTGEVGTGKSTLINALLRRKILPTSALVTTAIITEIKWGEEPGALLHFLNSEDDSALAPQEIAVDELAEYVTVIYEASKVDEILERRYEKVELFYPVELCRNGVEIIDSPGLGGGEVRAAITLRSLNAVDVVVYMLSATGPVTDSVQRWIKYFRAAGHQDIFFVVNRINEIPAVERETLKEHLARTLESAGLAAERVFLMNALGALEGHLSNDLAMLEESGLPQLEAALETFFIGQREQIKILRSANDLKESIRETRRAITEQKALLKEHLNSLEERHREMQEQLEERWQAEAVDLQARASNEDESQQIQDYTSQVLKDLREQVESTYLAEKQKSQAEVEQHSKKLASARKQLNKIDKELHTLISR